MSGIERMTANTIIGVPISLAQKCTQVLDVTLNQFESPYLPGH